MNRKKVNILWTGGWDSTYRLTQLSRENCIIQPYYVVNKKRGSLEEERNAIKEIYSILKLKKDTKAELLPVIELDRFEYVISKEIKDSYKIVLNKAKMGPQYEWLAAISKQIPDLEMSLERSVEKPTSYDLYIRNANYDIVDGDDKIMASYKLNQNNDPALYELLGAFRFPISVFTRSKMNFYEDFKNWGYLDVAEKTWFCSQPIDGKPCGYCAPCRNVMKQGLDFRMPEESKKRYRNKLYWMIKYKIRKTYLQIIGKW